MPVSRSYLPSLSHFEFSAFTAVQKTLAELLLTIPARMKEFGTWVRRGGRLQWFGEVHPERVTAVGKWLRAKVVGWGVKGDWQWLLSGLKRGEWKYLVGGEGSLGSTADREKATTTLPVAHYRRICCILFCECNSKRLDVIKNIHILLSKNI